ncbi:MAG: hypothetical protein MUD08_07420 [Cytophagales bacterium]|nr:hypothetical protein [Cytophagales bacterium]
MHYTYLAFDKTWKLRIAWISDVSAVLIVLFAIPLQMTRDHIEGGDDNQFGVTFVLSSPLVKRFRKTNLFQKIVEWAKELMR